MPRDLPPPELLRKLLRYEPETGKLFWRERTPDMFDRDETCRRWNSRHAGKRALNSHRGNGYLSGTVLYKKIYAHRAAWVMHCGKWPTGQIDHIDGNRHNNKAANLRDVSFTENSRNSSLSNRNKSGKLGVVWNPRYQKWHAYITAFYKRKHLGYFSNLEDAIKARSFAELEYGFHKNHGKDR